MDLGADIDIPRGFGVRHCMCDVAVEAFEVSLHGLMDVGRDMVGTFDCI